VALVGDLSVRTISLRWFVPSSSALIMALQMAHGHQHIANEKENLATLVRAELDAADRAGPPVDQVNELASRCSEVQRGLFTLRQRSERVPGFVYERFRLEDEADMRDTVAELRTRLGL
jgi:hypothetical protein